MDFSTLNGSGRNSNSLEFVFDSVDGLSERQARNKSKKLHSMQELRFGACHSIALNLFEKIVLCESWIITKNPKIVHDCVNGVSVAFVKCGSFL